MTRCWKFLPLIVFLLMLLPQNAPAAIIWRHGEGWSWEHGGVPVAANAKEQLELGRRYENSKEWNIAASCYRRLIKKWPTAVFAGEAQFRLGICLENQGLYYEALKAYQRALTRYPSMPQFAEVLEREFKIGNLFLGGVRHKIWKLKLFPGYDKAIEAFETVIRNAPRSELAPQAQFSIGLAYEKKKKWPEAVLAYQKTLDVYPDSKWNNDALFRLGIAYYNQSRSADYDHDAAIRASDCFTEFLNTNAQDTQRAPDAKKYLDELNNRDAEGLYKTARFYDSKHNDRAALIYYSELVRLHRESGFAKRIIPRMEEIKAKLQPRATASATAPVPALQPDSSSNP